MASALLYEYLTLSITVRRSRPIWHYQDQSVADVDKEADDYDGLDYEIEEIRRKCEIFDGWRRK